MSQSGRIIAHNDKTKIFNKEIEKHYKYLIDKTKSEMYIKETTFNGIDYYKFYFKRRV